jgi:hypothetical protein
MVVQFKLYSGVDAIYEIDKDIIETIIGRRPPWFVERQLRDDDAHFAVCPYCDNPIQLKAVYRRQQNSPRPYGSHVGKPVTGFTFDSSLDGFCPYQLKSRPLKRDARREPSEFGQELRKLAIEQFDRVIHVLKDDLGFTPSLKLSASMLRVWLISHGYDYVGAHRRNLPWMIAYLSKAENLYFQFIGRNALLARSIRERCPKALITDQGQLQRNEHFISIDMQFLHHKIEEQEDKTLRETLRMRVQDFTETNDARYAPTLYDQTITMRPERFEKLISVDENHPNRNHKLLDIAQKIAKEVGDG